MIPEEGGEHHGPKALVEIGLGDIFYEWNDLEAALAHIEQGLAWLPAWGKVDDFILAYVALARIHLAQANRSKAAAAVEKVTHLLQTTSVFPEALCSAHGAQIRLWLEQGEITKSAEWLEQQRSSKEEAIEIWRECEDIVSVHVLLALGKIPEAKSYYTPLTKSTMDGGRKKRLIEITILQALALHAAGSDLDALEIISRALALAQPEGFMRIFLDEGKPIFDLILLGKEQGVWDSSPLEAYTSRILLTFEGENITT